MNKLERIKFTDHSIDKIKFDDLEFSYIKDGQTKGRDRLWISFEVGKKSSLKGLKLCIHRSTRNKYFMLQYWFDRKAKYLSIGKYIPEYKEKYPCLDNRLESWNLSNGYN